MLVNSKSVAQNVQCHLSRPLIETQDSLRHSFQWVIQKSNLTVGIYQVVIWTATTQQNFKIIKK